MKTIETTRQTREFNGMLNPRRYYYYDDFVDSFNYLNIEDKIDYILTNRESGCEIELQNGLHFGMGIYVWTDVLTESGIFPEDEKFEEGLNSNFTHLSDEQAIKYLKATDTTLF